jgi:hypothetical protein
MRNHIYQSQFFLWQFGLFYQQIPRLTSSYDGTVKICSTTDWKVVKVAQGLPVILGQNVDHHPVNQHRNANPWKSPCVTSCVDGTSTSSTSSSSSSQVLP